MWDMHSAKNWTAPQMVFTECRSQPGPAAHRHARSAFPSPPLTCAPYPGQTFRGPPPNAGPTPQPSYVSVLKFGSPTDCSQLLTVTLSVVNSPVQMSTPIAIRTAPPTPMTTG